MCRQANWLAHYTPLESRASQCIEPNLYLPRHLPDIRSPWRTKQWWWTTLQVFHVHTVPKGLGRKAQTVVCCLPSVKWSGRTGCQNSQKNNNWKHRTPGVIGQRQGSQSRSAISKYAYPKHRFVPGPIVAPPPTAWLCAIPPNIIQTTCRMDNRGSKPWKKPISAQCPAHRKIQPHHPHTTPTRKGANGVYPVHKQQSVEYNRPDHWNSPSQPIPDQSWRIREDNLAEPQIPQETRNPGNPTSNSKSFQWNTNTRKGWWKQNTGTANHRQWKCTTATPATEQYQPANGDNAGQTRSSFIPSAPTQQTRIERTYPPERPLPMGGGGDIEHQWIALTFKPIVTWPAPWKASQL